MTLQCVYYIIYRLGKGYWFCDGIKLFASHPNNFLDCNDVCNILMSECLHTTKMTQQYTANMINNDVQSRTSNTAITNNAHARSITRMRTTKYSN